MSSKSSDPSLHFTLVLLLLLRAVHPDVVQLAVLYVGGAVNQSLKRHYSRPQNILFHKGQPSPSHNSRHHLLLHDVPVRVHHHQHELYDNDSDDVCHVRGEILRNIA